MVPNSCDLTGWFSALFSDFYHLALTLNQSLGELFCLFDPLYAVKVEVRVRDDHNSSSAYHPRSTFLTADKLAAGCVYPIKRPSALLISLEPDGFFTRK